jgi:hypothetical protein
MFVTLKVFKLIGPSNDGRRHGRGTYLFVKKEAFRQYRVHVACRRKRGEKEIIIILRPIRYYRVYHVLYVLARSDTGDQSNHLTGCSTSNSSILARSDTEAQLGNHLMYHSTLNV